MKFLYVLYAAQVNDDEEAEWVGEEECEGVMLFPVISSHLHDDDDEHRAIKVASLCELAQNHDKCERDFFRII